MDIDDILSKIVSTPFHTAVHFAWRALVRSLLCKLLQQLSGRLYFRRLASWSSTTCETRISSLCHLPTFYSTAEMEYLIRFIQMHEEFRKAEIESIAELLNIKFRWVSYIEIVGLPVN